METLDPEQALARFIELYEKRGQEIDRRPDLQLRMRRGDYDFNMDLDYEISDLEIEAERNGFYLEWTFEHEKNNFEYTCKKMTTQESEAYLEWKEDDTNTVQ